MKFMNEIKISNDGHDQNRDRWNFDFEGQFNMEEISSEKIRFARNYLETTMGINIGEDSLIEFSSIRSTIFGYPVAHLVSEYEKFIKKT